MAKIILIVVATLLVASSVDGHDLKGKLMRKFGIGPKSYGGRFGNVYAGGSSSSAATATATSGGFGGAYGSAAASSATGYSGNYGSSAASSAATTMGGGSAASSAATVGGGMGYGQQQQPQVQQQQQQQGGYMWGNQQQQQQAGMNVGMNQGAMGAAGGNGNGYGSMGGGSAAAASVQNNYYTPAPAPVVAQQQQQQQQQPQQPAEPQKPNFDINQFKVDQLAFRPYFGGAASSAAGVGGGYGAATSAAATATTTGGGNYGSGSAMASSAQGMNQATGMAANSGSYQQGGFVAPGTYSAASGTFANSNGNGIEQRHFSNEVSDMENHESGRADDDHYYHAQTYGKAADDNDHINYNKNYENVMASPTVYHSVKSNESLLRDHNKSNRETGSAVMAKDHHSAGYQKHQKNFHQSANSATSQNGAMGGAYGSETDNLNNNMNYDDEMYFDSDGLNNGGQAQSAVGYATNYGMNAGASSAVNGRFGSAASAAALGGNGYNYGASAASAVN